MSRRKGENVVHGGESSSTAGRFFAINPRAFLPMLRYSEVPASCQVQSDSNEDAALRLKRFDRHCINDTGALSPRFKAGEANHNNQPCCDFSLPLVSNADVSYQK